MDPLTALSLACNAVTLVDASFKAAKLCYQIYKHGASLENLDMDEISKGMAQCSQILDATLGTNATSNDITKLSVKIRQTAKTLSDELDALRSTAGRRGALLKAIQTKFKAKHIEDLKKKLDEYQKILDTQILIQVSHRLNTLMKEQNNQHVDMTEKILELKKSLDSCGNTSAAEFNKLFDRTIEISKAEHEKTRELLLEQSEANKAASRVEHERTRDRMGDQLTHQVEKDNTQREKDLILESLRFTDMNFRSNEISESYPDTFDWIFDSFETNRWDRFDTWLRHGDEIYWIHGKPGSGKSTLMKFIAGHAQTDTELRIWSGGKECLKITFYFWLVGSNAMQHNFKGFLCSLLSQILQLDASNDKVFHCIRPYAQYRRAISDWSISDLRNALEASIKCITEDRRICFFFDGVDEIDQDDDMRSMLNYIQDILRFPGVKVCISSRFETPLREQFARYPKLRLQDLTGPGMKRYIEQELHSAFLRAHRTDPVEEELNTLIHIIHRKAEGVFLWVKYALNTIERGVLRKDDNKLLEQRLDGLPSSMVALYRQMWQRMNGDEKWYQHEASEYFSYILEDFSSFRFQRSISRTLSVFELLVAVRPALQAKYFEKFSRLNPAELAKECSDFKFQLETRCAGMLQFTIDGVVLLRYDIPDPYSGRIPRPKSFSFDEEHDEEQPPVENLYLGPRLEWFQACKISLIHRTARDFLCTTSAGREIVGEAQPSPQDLQVNIILSRLAVVLQWSEKEWYTLPDFLGQISELKLTNNFVLLDIIQQVFEEVSSVFLIEAKMMRARTKPILDLEILKVVLSYELYEYVLYKLEANFKCISPRQCTSLWNHALFDLKGSFDPLENLGILKWLLRSKPSLLNYPSTGYLRAPIETLIETILILGTRGVSCHILGEPEIVEFMDACLSQAMNPNSAFFIRYYEGGPGDRSFDMFLEIGSYWIRQWFDWILAKSGKCPDCSTSEMPLNANKSFKVLGFFRRKTRYWRLQLRYLFEPDAKDSEILGQALKEVWWKAENVPLQHEQSVVNDHFHDLLEDSISRCKIVDRSSWEPSVLKCQDPCLYLDQTRSDLPEGNSSLAIESQTALSPMKQELHFGVLPAKDKAMLSRSKSESEVLGWQRMLDQITTD